MKIYDALNSKSEMCDFDRSVGRIAADYCYAYPPDIPVIVPGEVIDMEVYNRVCAMQKEGLTIIGVENNRFKVVKED